MNRCLKEKVVVITGSAEGIGYEIANKYLEVGAKLAILLDINEAKGIEAVKNLIAKHGDKKALVFMKCDVTKDLEEVSKEIFDKYKKIDVLVNNAGIVNESSVRKVMEINSIASMEWSMKFREHMRTDKGGNGGTIVNIGSLYSYAVDPYLAFYKASKYAVMGFSRTLGHAENYKRYGVRVVIICPGFTTTDAKQLCWDEQVTEFTKFVDAVKWQEPEDFGKTAVEVFKIAESGSAWNIIGGVPSEVSLIAEGDLLR